MSTEIKQKIVLVEDDHDLATMIKAFLQSEGFEVFWSENGLDAVALIIDQQPDIVVLDIMLPGIDGVEVCSRIRNEYSNPVLMLTAKDDDLTEVTSLNMGADGYLNKPVRPHILLAHIKALLRRNDAVSDSTSQKNEDPNSILIQDLHINLQSYTLHKEETEIVLTSGEFELLVILAKSSGIPINRDELYKQVRGIEYDGLDRSLDLRISSLRKKLGDDVVPYRYIKTIRGQGYILVS